MSIVSDLAGILLMTVIVMVALSVGLGRMDRDPRSHSHRPRHLVRH